MDKKNKKMDVNNVKSQMRKGMLEYCILLLLHKEQAYASDIIRKLKEARLIVVEGTLYPLLTRLKNDDLLSYEWVESTQGPIHTRAAPKVLPPDRERGSLPGRTGNLVAGTERHGGASPPSMNENLEE